MIENFDECIKEWDGGAIKDMTITKTQDRRILPHSVQLKFANCKKDGLA